MILDFPGIPSSGNDSPPDIPVLATAAGIQLDNDEGVKDSQDVESCQKNPVSVRILLSHTNNPNRNKIQ